jgi:hypothetical protein
LQESTRLTLPYKLNGRLAEPILASNTAQGRDLALYTVNTAFSKDILKNKATIAFNVSDIF